MGRGRYREEGVNKIEATEGSTHGKASALYACLHACAASDAEQTGEPLIVMGIGTPRVTPRGEN